MALKPVCMGPAILALSIGLAGCQSVESIGSVFDGFGDAVTQPAAPQAAEAEAPPTAEPEAQLTGEVAAAPGGAAGQPTPGGPQLLASQRQPEPQPQPQPAPQAQPQPQAQPEPQPLSPEPSPGASDSADTATAAGQGSLTDAARAAQPDEDRKVVPGPSAGGITGNLERRFDSLFGASPPEPVVEAGVNEASIVGTWQLDEEDGLRTCVLTFSSRESGSIIAPTPGCTGIATTVAGWGLFGRDLLLNDADKTVVARLKQSGDRWIGFTLETGIPVVLTRGG